jgi:hypothetical protein
MKRAFLTCVAFIIFLLLTMILINNLTYAIGRRFRVDSATADALFFAGLALSLGISVLGSLAIWRRLSLKKQQ